MPTVVVLCLSNAVETHKDSMILFTKPYQRQILALTPAFLTTICGGMFLSYGVFNNITGYHEWAGDLSMPVIVILVASFHFGLLAAAFPACLVYSKFEVFRIYFTASCIISVASLLLIIIPSSFIGIIISRCLFGFGFGIVYPISIIYASEISSPAVRAHSIFMLHVFLTLGILLFSIFTFWMNFNLAMRLVGSLTLALTVVSTALGYFTMISSHIFMMHNNSSDSLERFQYFQQDSTGNPHVESEAILSYIIDEKRRKSNFHGRHNMSALVVVLFMKLGYLTVFNALHNLYRVVLLSAFFTNYTHLLMITTRLCGGIAGFFILNRITKRLQFFISAIAISILLFVFGTLLVIYQAPPIWMPAILLIPLEFFLGLGLSPLADILKGELFPLKEKPVSVATAIVFGEVIHILCIILLYSWIFTLGSVPRYPSFIFGAFTVVLGTAVLLLLRDSRRQSLRIVANLYLDKR